MPESSVGDTRTGARVATRYYEIRCHIEPYPELTPMVVEARNWDEVLKKYPDAEFITILGDEKKTKERQTPREANTLPRRRPERGIASRRPTIVRRRRVDTRQKRNLRTPRPVRESLVAIALVSVIGLLLWIVSNVRS